MRLGTNPRKCGDAPAGPVRRSCRTGSIFFHSSYSVPSDTNPKSLARRILEEREKGTPVTIISDICRGSTQIAGLRFERDCAEVVYKSAMEAINSMKLQIRLMDSQLGREWGTAK